jgi:hypothetical protein
VQLWTEADVPPDIRPEVAERQRVPAERADLLRLEILRREGGVAVAPKLPARRLGPLVGAASCFATATEGGRPSTALVGATPGHPAIEAAIAEQWPREWSGYDPHATGAGALARAREAGAEIVLIPGLAVPADEPATRTELLEQVLAVEAELADLNDRILELRRTTR